MTRRLVVVGAGITGLSAAFEWRRRRPDDEIVVLEAGDRIGGKLHRVELAGHWYDTGPEAVLARVPEAVAQPPRAALPEATPGLRLVVAAALAPAAAAQARPPAVAAALARPAAAQVRPAAVLARPAASAIPTGAAAAHLLRRAC